MTMTIRSETSERSNLRQSLDGGRPVHPAITAAEALVEALVAIEDDAEAIEHGTAALAKVARSLDARAKRLRQAVLPEIETGYRAAERLVEARA